MASRSSAIAAQPKRGGPVTVRPSRNGQSAVRRPGGPAAKPRKSKVKGRVSSEPRHIPAFAIKATLVVVAVAVIFISYKVVAASSAFAIKKFEVIGNLHASEDEIIRVLKTATKNQSLLQSDLEKVRHDIEQKPIVRHAVVSRILPDTLRVTIEERQPIALARKESGAFVWLSADAVELGDLDVFHPAKMPPVLIGLSENDGSDHAKHDNKDRVALYQKILGDLGPESHSVEEIDLTNINPPITVFQLKDSRVTVHVGTQDYHSDLKIALNVVEAARQSNRSRLSELHVPAADVEMLISNPTRISYIYSLNGKLSFGFRPSGQLSQAVNRDTQQRRKLK
jgi:hypothetical protein